ncbi:hypothetical protein [Streptacidiphilus sp. PB12-B1b]|uniref:hypothetical protein n=1 Tax=Streptacidiphilus sp. PB12-B1b TaxID=2705012 RepID=UPI001CDB48F6|nr:hypothetical protein [Streptacidiphilus sp. PB12-B1b]
MIRSRVTLLVASLAAGAVLLTGCGSSSGAAAPAARPSAPAAGGSAPALLAPALDFAPGTALSNNAPADTGDFHQGADNTPAAMKWVQLSVGAAGTLNPVVLNGAGFTLYRFDKDTSSPSKSNCDGACATTWPPVLIRPGGTVFRVLRNLLSA